MEKLVIEILFQAALDRELGTALIGGELVYRVINSLNKE